MNTPSHLHACQLAGAFFLAAILAACSAPAEQGVTTEKAAPYDGIAADEIITLAGNEPFWSVKIENEVANYLTPDNPSGTPFEVTRFAGNNGLGFSGMLDGAEVTITVTPGECSDGMSDRTYPFTATVKLGEESLSGCGYTDKQGFTGEAAP
ncbi:MAG: COG3650 family protein [Erythrobacter sp.]